MQELTDAQKEEIAKKVALRLQGHIVLGAYCHDEILRMFKETGNLIWSNNGRTIVEFKPFKS